MRDWNWPMEYEPEFCIATCVAMENFQPLRRKTESETIPFLFHWRKKRLETPRGFMVTCSPVGNGFSHEVVLCYVLSEGHQSAGLI